VELTARAEVFHVTVSNVARLLSIACI